MMNDIFELEQIRIKKDDKRYIKLIDIIVPHVVSTIRDVKRVLGSFKIMSSMVGDDVDNVDILGFVCIDIKSPGLAAALRRNAGAIVFDGNPFSELTGGIRACRPFDEIFASICPDHERSPGIQKLVDFLFPRLSNQREDPEATYDEICYRRPLTTLLRLSVPAGVYPRARLIQIVQGNDDEQLAAIAEAFSSGNDKQLLDRLGEVYPTLKVEDSRIWVNLCGSLATIAGDLRAQLRRRRLSREIARAIQFAYRKRGDRTALADLVGRLLAEGEIFVTSEILRRHFFLLGLFNRPPRAAEIAAMDRDQVIALAEQAGNIVIQWIEKNEMLNLFEAQPLFLLSELGRIQHVRDLLSDAIKADARHVDRIVFWLFAPGYSTDRSGVDAIVDIRQFRSAVEARQKHITDMQTVMRESYENMLEHISLSENEQDWDSA